MAVSDMCVSCQLVINEGWRVRAAKESKPRCALAADGVEQHDSKDRMQGLQEGQKRARVDWVRVSV